MTGRQRLVPFALITSALALVPWSVVVISGRDAYAMPTFVLFVLGACSPSVAGIVLAYSQSPGDARHLLRDAVAVRLAPGLVAVLVVIVLGGLGGVAADHLLGTPSAHPAPSGAGGLMAAVVLAALMGPLNEELGWIGYATDPGTPSGLQGRAIAVGVMRLAWHLPMFAMVGTDQAGSSLVPFALAILSLQAFATVASLGAGVFGSVAAHAMFNATIAILPLGTAGYATRALLYVVAATVMVVRPAVAGGRRMSSRTRVGLRRAAPDRRDSAS